MKKLLHIIDSMGLGGAEKLMASIINGLDGKFEQHLIVLKEPTILLEEITVPCKITVLDFSSNRKFWKVKTQIARYIREHDVDIVHGQLYWANIMARIASGRKRRVFNTIHAISSEASYKINRATLHIEKFTYKKKHHIVFVSNEVLKDFDKWVGLKGPATVIYNMIDERFFSVEPKKSFSAEGLKLVAVGNLRWQKNYEYALEAFKSMPEGVTLDIYGEGGQRDEFQKVIDEFNLPVRLCGHHNNLFERLRDYDVYMMCSFYEGFSLGLMEAMAIGLPPIISDIPVLREAGGDEAMYIDIKDPMDLVRKVKYCMEHKQELASLSIRARQRAASLTRKDTYFRKLINLYEEVG